MNSVALVDLQTGEFIDSRENEAANIGALFRKAHATHVDSVRYLIECGQRLQAKRESLKHGEWLPWIAANKEALGFGESTARKLIAGTVRYQELATDLAPADALKINRAIWGHHNHRAQGTGENEWYTPPEYIAAAREALGTIDLDPASSEVAQEVVAAVEFFTAEDNGLEQEWRGRIWLNPPYAQPLIHQFIEKLCIEHAAARVPAAILLTHNYTDTEWFHLAARSCAAICFTRGRIKFVNPEGEVAAPTQGQAFFYFGSDVPKFIDAFSTFGIILIRP